MPVTPANLESSFVQERENRIAAERLLEKRAHELMQKNVQLEESAKALSATNTLLHEIMAAAPKGILLCTPDFIIREANPASERKLAGGRNDIIGKHLDVFFDGASKLLSATGDGEFSLDALQATDVHGKPLMIELHGFSGSLSSDLRYLLFFRDITDKIKEDRRRVSFERQIDEARRLEAIGALAAGIAHEINTPIQYIGDNLDFLKEGLKKIHFSYTRYEALRATAVAGNQFPELVAEIDTYNVKVNLSVLVADINAALSESREGIKQVRDIVLLMKEFAHPGTGEKEEADINKIVQNVVSISRNRNKGVAKIELALEDGLPPVKCRRGQIQQVILNILLNALDALDEAKIEQGRIRIATAHDDEFLKLSISDNGLGIPEALRQKIYDPFFTTKPVGKGTGQGLALAKDFIVKGHRGRLKLVDVEGFATTFLIELPFNADLDVMRRISENVAAA